MASRNRPHRAHVSVPVDHVTAERVADGFPVDWSGYRPTVTLVLDPSDPIVALASDAVEATLNGDVIELDLRKGRRRLYDYGPPIASDVPGPNRSPLWTKPRIGTDYSMVHLPGQADIADLPTLVRDWLLESPSPGRSELETAEQHWRAQAHRMLEHATAVVAALPETVTPDERHAVLRRLAVLANHVHYGQDGGLDPDEPEMVYDRDGDQVERPVDSFINSGYNDVLSMCDKVANSGDGRIRSDEVERELQSVALYFSEALPPRLAKAHRLGLLPSMLGVARTELVDAVWPGWRYLDDGEELRGVINPSLEALEALEAAMAEDKARQRRWPHDEVQLRWLMPAKMAVLVTSFLGNTIVRPVDGGES